MTDRKQGTIARILPDKAFGFITCPADGRDYFFHQSGLRNCTLGQLVEGSLVSFELGTDSRGRPQAEEIDRLKDDRLPEAVRATEPEPKARRGERRGRGGW